MFNLGKTVKTFSKEEKKIDLWIQLISTCLSNLYINSVISETYTTKRNIR